MGESENCSAIKRTLKNLCVTNGWSYGVFWGFDHINPMLLTLEDAYYEERLGSVIDNLLLKFHLLGEGTVGQAALNGKHQWVLADGCGWEWSSYRSSESSDYSFQVDSELYAQFSSGIKTIVVIPVEPRGVVQFGSTEKIFERLEFVDQTTRLFREVQNLEILNPFENSNSFVKAETCDINAMFASLMSSQNSDRDFVPIPGGNYNQPCPSTSGVQFGTTNGAYDLGQHGTHFDHSGSEFSSLCFQADSGHFMGNQDSTPSVFNGLFDDFDPDDFSTEMFNLCQTDDFSQWFASSLVESNANIGEPTNAPTIANRPRKGLFSELGLEEILGHATKSSSCLTGSNLEDRSFSAKRRRIESASSTGTTSLTKEEVPKSQVGLWIDDSYSITGAASAVLPNTEPRNVEENRKVVRKRARPGESTRPRPKDRQLIQDRIKELRGIIPNCGKCSIDSLLERTIKHMVFLQGVTKHGDKLKQPNKPKLIGNENGVVLRDKNDMSNGATWAYEVGGQSMVCPIIVEDLSSPGQMLIEMLCEEQGFFLEIADVIRGFGLSILKGVMEVREAKIWAHFIVEAKSHITRIDVFWSLVRLLQQTTTNAIGSDNQPSNVVLDGGIPLIESYPKSNLPIPICLAEKLH